MTKNFIRGKVEGVMAFKEGILTPWMQEWKLEGVFIINSVNKQRENQIMPQMALMKIIKNIKLCKRCTDPHERDGDPCEPVT